MPADKTAAELVAILKRAERREREEIKQKGAALLGDLFEEDRRRSVEAFRANNDTARDRLRSETDRLRHQDLEATRQLNELSEADEAERQDLATRAQPGGYYKPQAGPEENAS